MTTYYQKTKWFLHKLFKKHLQMLILTRGLIILHMRCMWCMWQISCLISVSISVNQWFHFLFFIKIIDSIRTIRSSWSNQSSLFHLHSAVDTLAIALTFHFFLMFRIKDSFRGINQRSIAGWFYSVIDHCIVWHHDKMLNQSEILKSEMCFAKKHTLVC